MIIRISSPFRYLFAMARTRIAGWLGYRTITSFNEQDARLDTCYSCKEILWGDQAGDGAQCKICTCLVEAKTNLTMEQCPRKKWLRIWDKKRTI